MIVDIQPANFETRIAILKSKCLEKRIECPDTILEYIAGHVVSNIRDLEGALNRVLISCTALKIPLTLESTRAALSGLMTPNQQKTYSVDTLLSLIADFYGTSVADIIGKKRTKELVYPRHITMYFMREELGLTYPQIGRELGGKDHSTIMHGFNKIVKDMKGSTQIPDDISQIKQKLMHA